LGQYCFRRNVHTYKHGDRQTRKQELIYGYQSVINDVFHISDVDVTSTINPRFDESNEFTLKIDSLKASMAFVTPRKAALIAVSLSTPP
jgi:hypothetical protein